MQQKNGRKFKETLTVEAQIRTTSLWQRKKFKERKPVEKGGKEQDPCTAKLVGAAQYRTRVIQRTCSYYEEKEKKDESSIYKIPRRRADSKGVGVIIEFHLKMSTMGISRHNPHA